MKDVIVICQNCGEVLYEGEKFKKCKHITKEEAQDFHNYIERRLKSKKAKWEYQLNK